MLNYSADHRLHIDDLPRVSWSKPEKVLEAAQLEQKEARVKKFSLGFKIVRRDTNQTVPPSQNLSRLRFAASSGRRSSENVGQKAPNIICRSLKSLFRISRARFEIIAEDLFCDLHRQQRFRVKYCLKLA